MKPRNSLILFVTLLLTACGAIGPKPVDTAVGSVKPTESPSPGQTPLQPIITPTSLPLPPDTLVPSATPNQCLPELQRQELKEPYSRDKNTNKARYTLSTEELNAYLSAMGIETLCIPTALGAPFLSADWNSASQPPVEGRIIALGFEALSNGGWWSSGFLLYSTYDSKAPIELDTFATPADWEAVRQGTAPDLIEVNGVQGLIHFKRGDFCLGGCSAYKTFVFPFETYYVAVIYDLGVFDYDADWETLFRDFEAGQYPPERQMDVAAMDYFATTIHFQSSAEH